jgi:hypothetical protein
MNLTDAQREMRFAYFGGAVGVAVSATAWTVAAVVAMIASRNAAMLTLFVGGILIHPVSSAVCKMIGRPARTTANPLETLAKEVVVLFIAAMPLLYVTARAKSEWFFPAMLLLIGARYLTFQTLFGSKLFWFGGAALLAAGATFFSIRAPFVAAPCAGAMIELLFAAIAIGAERKGETNGIGVAATN